MTHAEETLGLPSASGGEMLYQCPGSVALEAEAPEGTPSVEAIQGAEIAAALETDDFTELDEGGRTIAENLQRQREEALAKWQKDFNEPMPVIHKEERFWIHGAERKKVCSAKPDFAAIGKESALVIDEKTGFLPVTPAYRNIQARIQAVAVQHEFPRLTAVRAIISAYRFRGRVDPVDYIGVKLAEAHQELFFRLWNTRQPHAPRVPGSWCRYCRAKTLCPQHASWAMLPMVHTGSEPLKKQDARAVADRLTLEQLAYIVVRLPMLNNFAEAVKDRLKGCSDEELASVGLRRQATGTVTVCNDIQKLWGVVHGSGLMTEDEFRSCLKPVIGQIEAKLADKILPMMSTKELAAKAAKQILAPAVEQKPKQPTIKPLKALPDSE